MDPKLKRQMQTVDKKANIFGDVVRTLWFRGDENLDDNKLHTPGPWLVRFFRSGKNPHEPNPHHLSH